MRTYVMELGAYVWDVVDNGYVKLVVLANKDEVLLSATCSGGAIPKKKVTFFH